MIFGSWGEVFNAVWYGIGCVSAEAEKKSRALLGVVILFVGSQKSACHGHRAKGDLVRDTILLVLSAPTYPTSFEAFKIYGYFLFSFSFLSFAFSAFLYE